MTADHSLRDRIAAGDCLYGLIVKMPNQPMVEMAGYTGFDLVMIDTEHGMADDSALENHLRSARLAGVSTLVRLGHNDPLLILRALDAGATGVVIPHVSTAGEAAAAVSAAHYPPIGTRGLAVSTIAGHHGTVPLKAHLDAAAATTFVVAQAEDKEASANSAAIAAVPGLDAVWIGPSDLSMSLGQPGQTSHPAVAAAIDRIADNVTSSAGCALCVIADSTEDAAVWAQRGARIILFNSTKLLADAFRGAVSSARDAVQAADAGPGMTTSSLT
ncbi:2,4-dihydroxyhept-2-ene-1,7-dioic acid aldolase [Pseudarthrobacter sp. NIBRBAC000502772]|uniref:HpcH/HpaI aldolase family protein n=1 Tax=Pseudarthrobacter sp. NIBRBAC000502772 TaxID=2590775 RepID=UPI001130AF37|nr:aldolase/citrate lyase family protein [Pseudarthrobacter sp. NIBRBAC000502772]QDG65217.1 2,4-dihydroxyhept-2-ene-1,7-dioic acid aldolase [Pseudarthrobacter sp. NIBRBAC000502772]